MSSLGRLLLAYILSALVSGMAAVQFAQMTHAREEFIVVLVALSLFLIIAIVVFSIGAFVSGERSTLTILALGLAALIVVAAASVLTLTRASLTAPDMAILATFASTALIGLAVQWWMVRRLFA